jgi:hypothetical protein
MANPDAESMIMRMSAQVSLVPAQTSHASNLKKLREIAAVKSANEAKKQRLTQRCSLAPRRIPRTTRSRPRKRRSCQLQICRLELL